MIRSGFDKKNELDTNDFKINHLMIATALEWDAHFFIFLWSILLEKLNKIKNKNQFVIAFARV